MITTPIPFLPAELRDIQREVEKRHDERIGRLQDWIRHPAIAAEDHLMDEGCELMSKLALDAGFTPAQLRAMFDDCYEAVCQAVSSVGPE